jgi:hypothetical protein
MTAMHQDWSSLLSSDVKFQVSRRVNVTLKGFGGGYPTAQEKLEYTQTNENKGN